MGMGRNQKNKKISNNHTHALFDLTLALYRFDP